MLTRNPSDAFPSSYELQLRCTHFKESLLRRWFESDHDDPEKHDADEYLLQQVTVFGGGGANHTDVREHCSTACSLCSDELSSSHSSSSRRAAAPPRRRRRRRPSSSAAASAASRRALNTCTRSSRTFRLSACE